MSSSSNRYAPSRLALAAIVAAAAAVLGAGEARAQCPTSDFTTGLESPNKIVRTKKGNLLVAEAGNGPNTGRVSIIAPDGTRRTLVSGLPSSQSLEGEMSGPTGLAIRGGTLYIAIGAGDVVVEGQVPGTEEPNPTPSSPIFSSVIAMAYGKAEKTTTGFTMTTADHATLKSGRPVALTDAQGHRTAAVLLADFPDYVPANRQDAPNAVIQSNPYALAAEGLTVYVADASLDKIVKVDVRHRQFATLATLPKVPNPLPFGPPVADAVPDGIRIDGDRLLVSQLTGFPFAAGVAKIHAIDKRTGAISDFITGLTTSIDVLPYEGTSGEEYYVLEYSTDFLANAPGRLLHYDSPTATPTVVADCLVSPTGMERDTAGNVFVTEIFTGKVVEIPADN